MPEAKTSAPPRMTCTADMSEAHVEVAVADEGDGEQLDADDPEGHVERQADVRYEER